MAHINPGTDTTINPVVIDDSYRERKRKEQPRVDWVEEVRLRCYSYTEFYGGERVIRFDELEGVIRRVKEERKECRDAHASAPLQTERLCDDCNIIEIENKLADTERQLIMAQQRVDAAIKELERLAAEKDQLKKESKTNEPWMGHAYAASAYMKAIALLQAGRK